MRLILLSSLGVSLLLALSGCKSSSGDSMGSMKMGGDDSMSKSPATMPATMPK